MSEKKKELIRAIKFTLFSLSAGLIQFGSFAFMDEVLHMPYWPAYLIALTLSVLWNFTINRKFTFKSANNVPIAMFKVFVYYAVFTPLSTWWGKALTDINWNEYVVLLGTMVINFVTEFLFDRFFVFGKSIDTNIKPEKSETK
jgi:putative flippase GtrA